MSDLETLLERVAREVEKEAFAYKKPIDIGGLLKCRLLPMLEAGQACAERLTELFESGDCGHWEIKDEPSLMLMRAAKQRAMEG